MLSRRELQYDGAGKGNVIEIKDCIDAPACTQHATATISYVVSGDPDTTAAGAAGLPTKITDPRGYETKIFYGIVPSLNWDGRGLKPSRITNALGHQTRVQYDFRYGVPLQVAEPTGKLTSTFYDAFGRPTEVFRNGISMPFRTFAYEFGSPGSPPTASRIETSDREPNQPDGFRDVSTFYDSFGRELEAKREDFVDGVSAIVVSGAVSFDGAGRVERTWAPFVTASAVEIYQPPTGNAFKETQYDVRDRVTKVTNTDLLTYRTTSYAAAGETLSRDENATAYDEGQSQGVSGNGRRTKTIHDAFGRAVEVQEFDGPLNTSGLRSFTRNLYDALGRVEMTTSHLTLEEAPGSNFTSVFFDYDGLGRRTSMDDPDSAAWTYVYDAAGNLVLQQDPKLNQHVEMCYDKLNRLRCTYGVANDSSSQAVSCASVLDGDDACPQPGGIIELLSTRTYDFGNEGKGKLRKTTDYTYAAPLTPASTVSTELFYNNLGLVTQEIRLIQAFGIGPKEISQGMTYDGADRLLTITYPTANGSEILTMTYDPGGHPYGLTTSGQTYALNGKYDVFGRQKSVQYGAGLLTNTFGFGGPGNRYRLEQIAVTRGSGATATVLQDFRYDGYDKSGNLTLVDDDTPSYPNPTIAAVLRNWWEYDYDGMGRLTTATPFNFAWSTSASFTYDLLQNMTTGRNLQFTHSTAFPHRIVSSAPPGSGPQYVYDDNGSLTTRPDTDAGSEDDQLTFAYDAQGRVDSVRAGTNPHVNYVSDTAGLRAARQIGSQTTFYFGKGYEITGDQLTRHIFFAGKHIADSTIGLPAGSSLIVAKLDPRERDIMVARALVDFAAESSSLYPQISLRQEEAAKLGALLLFVLVLLGLTPGRLPVGMSRGRSALFRRLRRGHVLVVLAVFAGSLTPLTCVKPAEGTGGGCGTCPPSPPPPSYPVYFIHHDQLGSASMLTCANRPGAEGCADGAVKRYFRYDSYGLTKAYDAAGNQLTGDQNLVDRLYTGQRWEWQAKVYDYNARFYEPRTARFTVRDALREFVNPYSYVRWRPTGLTDPTGMFSLNTYFNISDPDLAARYMKMTGGEAQGGGGTGANGGPGGVGAPGGAGAPAGGSNGGGIEGGVGEVGAPAAEAPSGNNPGGASSGDPAGGQTAQLDPGFVPGMSPVPEPSLHDATVPSLPAPVQSSVPIEPGYADFTVNAPLPGVPAGVSHSAILTSNDVVLEGWGFYVGTPGYSITQSLNAASPGWTVSVGVSAGGATVQGGATHGYGEFGEFGTGSPGWSIQIMFYGVKGRGCPSGC